MLISLATLAFAFCLLPLQSSVDGFNTMELISVDAASLVVEAAQCEDGITEVQLMNLLLQNYTKQARPVLKPSRPVNVLVGLRLFGIREFVEHTNTLIFDGYFTMQWYDEFIQWSNMTEYKCIDTLVFDTDILWSPNLKILTGMIRGSENMPVDGEKTVASNNGSMYFYVMGEFNLRCELDVLLFPFDEQHCEFVVESWSYPKSMQSISFLEPPFATITHFWTENDLWELTGNHSKIVNPIYINDDGIYDRVVFTIMLQRKPLFYYVHVIAPSLIISIAELVTFVLPVGDYIKVHISFTCLLAYSVFEDMIISDMPKSSKKIPLLSLYIDLQMAYIGVLALLGEGVVCVLLRQSDFQKKEPPAWLFKIFLFIGRHVFCQCGDVVEMHSRNLKKIHSSNTRFDGDPLDNWEEIEWKDKYRIQAIAPAVAPFAVTKSARKTMSYREQWTYIAEVVSRCNMWLYLIALVTTPAVLFSLKQIMGASPNISSHD